MKTITLITTLFLAISAHTLLAQALKPATLDNVGTPAVKNAAQHGMCAQPTRPVFSNPLTAPMLDSRVPLDLSCSEGEEEENEELEEYKERLMIQKLREIEAMGDQVPNPFTGAADRSPDAISPVLTSSFNATQVGSGNPPDNSMAISNGGYVVVSVNSSIAIYNTSGTNLGQWSLYSFFNGAGSGVTNDFYDPQLIYDSYSDRFVFACSVGRQSSTSRVLVAFSSSNNPLNGWNSYYITSNVLNNSTWLDYPKLGFSNKEVYVAGNLYTNGSAGVPGTFNQAIVWQIPKAAGYAGQYLPWQYWYNLSGSPFAVHPVSYGTNGGYGPGVYLIAHNTGSGSTVKLYDITNDMSASNETINYYSISVPAYAIGTNAVQSGTTQKLDVGDCRALGSFYMNGIIHYTFNAAVGSTVWNGIVYHRLNVSTKTVTSKTISAQGFDLTYPAVAWAGTGTNKSVVISFQYSNSTNFPGVGALTVDDALNNSSPWTACAWGAGNITLTGNASTPTISRWGDYNAIQRRKSSSPPVIWGATSFGNSSHTWTDRVYQLGGPFFLNGGETQDRDETPASIATSIYPNPAVNGEAQIAVEQPADGSVTIQISNLFGADVRTLVREAASKGINRYNLPTADLPAGTYLVSVVNEQNQRSNEKLVVVH